jgi:hypothetical protein
MKKMKNKYGCILELLTLIAILALLFLALLMLAGNPPLFF